VTVLFKRAAKLIVDTIELVIDPEAATKHLDIEFAVERSLKPEPNTAEIKVWNLNPDNRSALEEAKQVPVVLEAGYKDQTALIFSGTARTIFSVREGADIATVLQSGDAEKEYQTSRISLSVGKATPNLSVMQQIVKKIGVGEGNLSTFSAQLAAAPLVLPAGGVLSGSASQIMTRIAQSLGFEWSIQEGAIQLLQVSEPLTTTAVLLTPNTGLVGTPSVDSDGLLTAQTLLIPELFPGRLVELESERLSGSYRVEKCAYGGTTYGDDWYIDFEAKKL